MSLNRGPKIITNGLFALYDAADRNSYPGSGTTWFDISGNGRNGTLTNGVGYSTTTFPTLTFNGVDNYVNLPFALTQSSSAFVYTMFTAAKLSTTSTNKMMLFGSDNGGWDWGFGAGNYSTSQWTIFTGAGEPTAGIQDTNWHIFTAQWTTTATKLYIDNNLIITSGVDWDSNVASNASIGRNPGFGEYWPGNIALFQIYNRVLSDAEIQQNFDALRGRFGI